jgi:hypothetical protein
MKLLAGLLVCAVSLVGAAGTAGAVTIKPSGKYAFTSTDSCEAKFTFSFKAYLTSTNPPHTDNAVRTINSVVDGNIGAGIGSINFVPKTASGGNFSITITNIGGGSLRINNGGFDVSVSAPETFNGTYTYTANSLTLTPPPAVDSPATFVMAYGQLPASGIPTSIHLVRKHSSEETNNCVESFIITK